MPRTLLLADDSVTIQKVVGISFANEDVVLLSVDNGDDAIRRAREARPDLVLADVVMPGKNGYEVCRAIKSDPELRHIPVVLLTGTFEAFDHERAREVGADAHITKPFESQALVDRVNELLSQRSDVAARAAETGVAVRPAMGAPQDLSDDDLPQDPSAPRAEPQPVETAETAVLGEAVARGSRPLAEGAGASPGDGALPSAAPAEERIDETVAFLPETEARGSGEGWPGDLQDAFADPGPQGGAPDARGAETDLLGGEVDGTPEIELVTPRAPSTAEELGTPDDEGFDLGVDEAPDAPSLDLRDDGQDPLFGLADEPLSRESVLDPDAARSYDVSSSDLETSLGTREPLDAEPPGTFSTDGEAFAPRAADAAASRPAPQAAATAADDFALGEKAAELEPFELEEPRDLESPELEEPGLMAAEELRAGRRPQAASTDGPERDREATAPEARRPDVTPALRARVHDTLEKIAWEALGDLSDTVTRQVIERVEAIAWEVIPQMAEVLIREEIQRLKGEDEER